MLGITTITASLKYVFAFDFDVGHNHSQHLFMNVDSRYPVRHNDSSWRERRACCDILKQGHRLSPLPQQERDNAQLFNITLTFSIKPFLASGQPLLRVGEYSSRWIAEPRPVVRTYRGGVHKRTSRQIQLLIQFLHTPRISGSRRSLPFFGTVTIGSSRDSASNARPCGASPA
jgi:hypothetical protein